MSSSRRSRPFFFVLAPAVALGLGSLFSFLAIGNLDRSSGASPALASGWTVKEASAFQEFPIYWVGDDFGGLPLRQIIRYEYAGDPTNTLYPTSEDSVTVEYGDCEIPPGAEGGCPIPLVIETDSYCDVPPERISDSVKTGPPVMLRGAQAQWMGDYHVRIWTGNVSIGIWGTNQQMVKDAAERLAGLNGSTPLRAGEELGPPQAMCAQRDWHWNNPPPEEPKTTS